jgi:enoyl-CoA hydratase/carnithine racemase
MTGTLSPVVRFEAADGVGTITLDRPKVNAYEIGLMTQLRETVAAAEADPAVAVVVVRSALPSVFCVGADIKAWAASELADNQRLVDIARATANAIAGSRKVYVAAINGHALGGGLELALAADLRFAVAGVYQLGLPEVRLGLMPGNGGTQRLARLIGSSRALALVATGDSVGPDEALAIGLVDRVIPDETFEDELAACVRALARGPAGAIAAIKTAIREGQELSVDAGLALEASLSDGLYGTPDGIEGLRAYIEKREPRFGGADTT